MVERNHAFHGCPRTIANPSEKVCAISVIPIRPTRLLGVGTHTDTCR